jgi:hypothetical protein
MFKNRQYCWVLVELSTKNHCAGRGLGSIPGATRFSGMGLFSLVGTIEELLEKKKK